MHCIKFLATPLDAVHTKDKTRFKSNIPRGAFPHKTPGSRPWDSMDCASAYPKKQMTYEMDVLNAMQGIFHAFEKAPQCVHQLWGVPILPSSASSSASSLEPVHLESYEHMSRTAIECFAVGLLWRYGEVGKRRPQFPSWSWAGWRSSERLRLQPRLSDWDEKIFTNSKLWIEDVNGQLLGIPDLARSYRSRLELLILHTFNCLWRIESQTIKTIFTMLGF